MAQYKVLQDIEAEDKLLGPLSLRQFIYAVIVVVLGFVIWQLFLVQWLLVIPFIPPTIFFAMLAAPFGHDQSSEVWMLAKIKYFIFPRNRIWNQDGILNLVKITVPKVEVKQVTKDFDKNEAKSRLKALAATMDTRGWIIKNVTTRGYMSSYGQDDSSDRLLVLETIPQDDIASIKPSEDILDPTVNPLAQVIDSMQAQNQQVHRQAILKKMQTYSLEQRTAQPPTASTKNLSYASNPSNMNTPVNPVHQSMTETKPPAILKEVKSPPSIIEVRPKATTYTDGSTDEVTISLH